MFLEELELAEFPLISSSTKNTTTSTKVAVWRSSNELVSNNEVNLQWARLVLEWVTVSGFDSRRRHHFISVCNQQPVDSAFYSPWDGKISTSQKAVMLCGWGVKAGIV